MMGVLRELVMNTDDSTQATLLFANKTEKDILFRDELSQLSLDRRVRVVHTLTCGSEVRRVSPPAHRHRLTGSCAGLIAGRTGRRVGRPEGPPHRGHDARGPSAACRRRQSSSLRIQGHEHCAEEGGTRARTQRALPRHLLTHRGGGCSAARRMASRTHDLARRRSRSARETRIKTRNKRVVTTWEQGTSTMAAAAAGPTRSELLQFPSLPASASWMPQFEPAPQRGPGRGLSGEPRKHHGPRTRVSVSTLAHPKLVVAHPTVGALDEADVSRGPAVDPLAVRLVLGGHRVVPGGAVLCGGTNPSAPPPSPNDPARPGAHSASSRRQSTRAPESRSPRDPRPTSSRTRICGRKGHRPQL